MRCAYWMLLLTCCTRPVASPRDEVRHDAYVWRRMVTESVRQSMREAPAAIARFKVLSREHEGKDRREVVVPWQASDLSRAVVLVWRINGTASLDGLSIAPLQAQATQLLKDGADITGVEVDYDCPTARLAAYATWLRQQRAMLPTTMMLTITALPTWSDDAAGVAALANEVDGITVQVHAVAAPVLFDPQVAHADFARFMAVVPEHRQGGVRVALPTYRATLADGQGLSAQAADIQRFRQLNPSPQVSWFRLGADDDRNAWNGATLGKVIAGDTIHSIAQVELRATDDPLLFDIVLHNPTANDVDAPSTIAFQNIVAADGSRGYGANDRALMHRSPPRLRPGDDIVIGWVRGSGSPVVVEVR